MGRGELGRRLVGESLRQVVLCVLLFAPCCCRCVRTAAALPHVLQPHSPARLLMWPSDALPAVRREQAERREASGAAYRSAAKRYYLQVLGSGDGQ